MLQVKSQMALFDAIGERDRILARMAENHAVYLEAVRAFARDIARRKGDVSIDDVRQTLEEKDFPLPSEIGADERIFGALFAAKEFYPIRQIPTRRLNVSKRVGRARSFITVYGIRGNAA